MQSYNRELNARLTNAHAHVQLYHTINKRKQTEI